MNLPRTADALFRAILAAPEDEWPKLVFADWLEDTGLEHNMAWATFLRANTNAHPGCPAISPAVHNRIQARLTVSASHFMRHAEAFIRLLPSDRIHLRLSHFEPMIEVLELVPEAWARAESVLPLCWVGEAVVLVFPERPSFQRLSRWEFILNRSFIATLADRREILAALDRGYGETTKECVESILYEFPEAILASGVNPTEP